MPFFAATGAWDAACTLVQLTIAKVAISDRVKGTNFTSTLSSSWKRGTAPA
jgi:hypothetical protein